MIRAIVRGLGEVAAFDGPQLDVAGLVGRAPQEAQVLFGAQAFQRGGLEVGRGEHLDKELGHGFDQGKVDRTVDRHDGAEGRGGIRSKGAPVGLVERGPAADAARVVVFDDDTSRLGEESNCAAGGVGVEQVVPGELFAVQLLHAAEEPRTTDRVVNRRGLVRVFAVTRHEVECQFERLPRREGFRSRLRSGLSEPGGDGGVVTGGVAESFERQLLAQACRHHAIVLRQGGGDPGVVGRVDNHGHPVEVFGRGADHRRPADVDHFDDLVECSARGHGFFEGIEVADHEVDTADAVGFELVKVGSLRAVGKDAAMDARVQGFDAAVQDFGMAGDLGDRHDGQAVVLQVFFAAAGRNQLDAQGAERAGEVEQALFVVDRKQGALSFEHELEDQREGAVEGRERTRGSSWTSSWPRRGSRTRVSPPPAASQI